VLKGRYSGGIFVVCRPQNRSPQAARLLIKVGFSTVVIIKDDMTDWNKQDMPIEK